MLRPTLLCACALAASTFHAAFPVPAHLLRRASVGEGAPNGAIHALVYLTECGSLGELLSADEGDAFADAGRRDDIGGPVTLAREYPGRSGWTQLYKDRGMNRCTAWSVSIVRLFFWHLIQPVVYGLVLYVYWFDIDEAQRILAVMVAMKEGIYVLIILYALVKIPAVLLVNLHVSVTCV